MATHSESGKGEYLPPLTQNKSSFLLLFLSLAKTDIADERLDFHPSTLQGHRDTTLLTDVGR
ncbi:hypothetical protein HNR55_002858 [Acetobacter lovaniensis]|uniref:Uncharacterized protein n=1 Tax=Acetobacter lovaniensis TaxID=104100 RepID=A0A841QI48_9PROT|nr:hypothetical protein [Acetobacter lovaniensis]